MKYRIIRLVLVLLAVLVAASCDVNQPHEEIEQEPEPPEMVSVLIQASEMVDGDSVRVTNASIEFNGNGYNNKVVATNGIFDEMLEARDVDIDVYAYAEGFKTADTLTINISNDVNEIIILEREDEEPEPEGPGKLEFTAQSCAEVGSVDNGTLTVKAVNGFTAVRLINVENNEVVKDIAELTPKENQEYTFTGVPNGEYKAVATLNERESTTGDTVVVDCDQPDPNKAPEANLDITTNGLTALYDASGSSDTDGAIVTYRWDFDNDGEIDKETDDPTTSREFSDGGNYTGRVEVVDNNGATDEATDSFTLQALNNAPEATFNFTTNGLNASFDASGSSDSDGDITSYSWKFGDGTTGSGITPDHPYDEEGTYSVTLTVTDNDGATDTFTKEVTVERPNRKPDVKFTVEDKEYLTVTFKNRSSDPDGDELSCQWTFGDGNTSTKMNPSHTYEQSGEYAVKLTCEDPEGASDSYEKDVTVEKEPDPNQDPEATFNFTTDGLNASFDASGSSDSDGDITSYSWKFGDGTTGSGITPDHPYDEEGTYSVTLTVTDNDGATDETTKDVAVEVLLSDEYSHKVVFGEESIWVSNHEDRQYDDLLMHGEVRPILTDEDPYGNVKIKVKFRLDEDEIDTEHFALEIYFNSNESDAFRTPIYTDKSGVNGWTTATVTVNASNFSGHSKDIAGINVIHGDEIDDSKPAGPDDVYFSTEDTDGSLWFYWRVQLNGQQKALTQSTSFESVVDENGTTTRALN